MKSLIQILFFIIFYLLVLESLSAQWNEVSKPYRFNGIITSLYFAGPNLIAGVQGDIVSGGLFYSTNNGTSWNEIMNNNIIWSLGTNGSNVYAGTAYGIYVSNNYGVSWNLISTLYNVFVFDSNSQCFLAGTDSGLYISYDKGKSWSRSTDVHMNHTIKSLVSNGTNVYASSPWNINDDSYVFRSTDNG
jgi:photosystem II stability/assembly factor-like uncharacterized protein